ncbi:MAG: PH domain-containing protein [Sedimentisphaerales bacterium]|nr:PH domain-containing protein [Sedimentisphaerales bacterium]
MEFEQCSNCETKIGKLESAYLHNGMVVCEACDKKLKSSVIAENQKHQPTSNAIHNTPREQAKEEILCSINPTWLRSHPLATIILLPFVMLTWPIYIFWIIKSKCTLLIISNKRTTLREGFFSKATTEVRHKDIRNISIEQSFFERILNVGTIGISSSAQADFEIVVKGIHSPHKKAEILRRFQE